MSGTIGIKGFYLGNTGIGKMLYNKKPELKITENKKVINNITTNNFSKPKTKTKYWHDKNWVQGVVVIGTTSYSYRSSWEVIYAKYLEILRVKGVITKWEYEPEIFRFHKVKRGLKGYVPDFRITYPDGRKEFHEIKGHMDSKAKTKLKRFAEYYPDITLKVIDKKWFDSLKEKGIKIA